MHAGNPPCAAATSNAAAARAVLGICRIAMTQYSSSVTITAATLLRNSMTISTVGYADTVGVCARGAGKTIRLMD
jgi:hypothetical protein